MSEQKVPLTTEEIRKAYFDAHPDYGFIRSLEATIRSAQEAEHQRLAQIQGYVEQMKEYIEEVLRIFAEQELESLLVYEPTAVVATTLISEDGITEQHYPLVYAPEAGLQLSLIQHSVDNPGKQPVLTLKLYTEDRSKPVDVWLLIGHTGLIADAPQQATCGFAVFHTTQALLLFLRLFAQHYHLLNR